MINICCLWVDNKYDYQYVRKLYNGIDRFININYSFYCFVDSDSKIEQIDNNNIIPIKLTGKYKTVWNKVEIISTPLNNSNSTTIFFDLDTLILDSFQDIIDWAVDYKSNLLALCNCVWRMDKGIEFYQFGRNTNQRCTPYNSSIMCWNNNIIIDECMYENKFDKYRGFDEFVWMNYLRIYSIPPEFYYSAFFVDFQLLDFPVCLLNQTHLKNNELSETYSWMRKYW